MLSFLRSDWKRRLVRLGSHGDEIIIYRDQEGKKLAQRALLTAARINHGAAGTNLSMYHANIPLLIVCAALGG